MGLFTGLTLNTLDELLINQLSDLYDAEKRLTKAIPKMAKAATNPQLVKALEKHLKETENHVTRLDKVFELMETKPQREACEAMKGLIEEGDEILSASGDPNVLDAAIIASAQRVEHYEMAGYGTVRSLAKELGRKDVADLLQKTLDEEGEADKTLTSIAESRVNAKAAKS